MPSGQSDLRLWRDSEHVWASGNWQCILKFVCYINFADLFKRVPSLQHKCAWTFHDRIRLGIWYPLYHWWSVFHLLWSQNVHGRTFSDRTCDDCFLDPPGILLYFLGSINGVLGCLGCFSFCHIGGPGSRIFVHKVSAVWSSNSSWMGWLYSWHACQWNVAIHVW